MPLTRAYEWVRTYRPFLMDLVRIYLGAGLLIKGIFFLSHPDLLAAAGSSAPASLVKAIPYVHIVGGLLMAVGIATRIAAAIQIPIVAGALLLVNLPRMTGIEAREAVEFSALTLFLLVLIAIWGAGPLALDRRLGKKMPAGPKAGWLEGHSDLFMDLIRAYLGIGLFVKGFYILQHQGEFQKLVENTSTMPFSLLAAAHYVIPVHFVGGALLLLGLLTRFAALAQIPLLIGAVFYVYLPRLMTLELRQNFEFAALVLFLLCVITIYGAGRYSLDYVLQRSAALQDAREFEAMNAGAKA